MTATAFRQSIGEVYSLKGNESLELLEALDTIEQIMPMALNNDVTAMGRVQNAIQHFLDSGEEFIGCGTTRICFTYGADRIVKVPYTLIGIKSSLRELQNFENFREAFPPDEYFDPDYNWFPTAECRELYLDFPHPEIITMEWVTPVDFYEELPRWVDYVDCGQVGYNAAGDLVAYDL
jgi:hypothetical protein